ncbi:MAG: circadian clock KaiB family protein [Candidatus Anammoxibacter sp.]
MAAIALKLFIANQSDSTEEMINNLKVTLEKLYNSDYDLDVIDIFENNQEAEIENVIATPTLLRKFPLPERAIIGDLNDTEKIMSYLK